MDYFSGKKIVIATKHEKEKVIGKLFKGSFDVEVGLPNDFDTDQFGTFTRDIKRDGNQLEVARKKAVKAIEVTGVDIAIASEGSFSPHRSLPWVTSNLELVLLLDKDTSIEVRGYAYSVTTNFRQKTVSTVDEVLSFAKEVGFPLHGVIMRKNETSKKMYKDVQTWDDLDKVSKKLLGGFFAKTIFIETDMRAHRNPTRMKVIEEATKDLIKNINSSCPVCGTIGFSRTQFIKGLPCSFCGLSTDVPGTFLYECQRCQMKEERKEGDLADPKDCSFCNP